MKRTRAATFAVAFAFTAVLAACNKQGVIDESALGSPPPEGSMVAATPAGEGMPGMSMGDASIPPDAETFTVHATEFAFEPKDVTAPADETLAVTLVNDGQVEHDWVVTDASGADVPNAHAHAVAGTTATVVFELPEGSYQVYCSIPGHKEAGMTGTLTVA